MSQPSLPPRRIQIQSLPSSAGTLVVMDPAALLLPFEINRVYSVNSIAKGRPRGFHAHRALFQFMYCAAGAFRFDFVFGPDLSRTSEELALDGTGLLVGPLVWREFEALADNSVLVVAASSPYCESDYIRNFGEFQREVLAG